MSIRVTKAAEILGLHPMTVRKWCNEGKLEYSYNAAGQRVFEKEYLENYLDKINDKPTEKEIIFYARSSDGNDVLIETQIEKLEKAYGKPEKIFKDKASGLNENRKGMNQLLNYIIESKKPIVLCVANKDRLTRFGFNYIQTLIASHNCKIEILDSDETKEPHEVLMQDFMSLLASFSGKFYRLRGWEQRKKFLKDVQNEVDKNGKEEG